MPPFSADCRRGKKCDEEWSEEGHCQRCLTGQWPCTGRSEPSVKLSISHDEQDDHDGEDDRHEACTTPVGAMNAHHPSSEHQATAMRTGSLVLPPSSVLSHPASLPPLPNPNGSSYTPHQPPSHSLPPIQQPHPPVQTSSTNFTPSWAYPTPLPNSTSAPPKHQSVSPHNTIHPSHQQAPSLAQPQQPVQQPPPAHSSQIVTSFPQAIFDFSSQNPNLSALAGLNGLQGMTTHPDGSVAFETTSPFFPTFNPNPFGQMMWNGQLEAGTGGGMTDLWDDFDQIFDIRTPTLSQAAGTPAVGTGGGGTGTGPVVQGRPLFYGERPMRQGVSLAEICESAHGWAQGRSDARCAGGRVMVSRLAVDVARVCPCAYHGTERQQGWATGLPGSLELTIRRDEGSALCSGHRLHLPLRFGPSTSPGRHIRSTPQARRARTPRCRSGSSAQTQPESLEYAGINAK